MPGGAIFCNELQKTKTARKAAHQLRAQRSGSQLEKEEQRSERALTFEKKSEQAIRSLLRRGAGDEARTRYLHLGKVALYQMSYTRIDDA